MATKKLIPADDVCIHHQLETTFIHDLEHEGLIKVSMVDKKTFIPANELPRLEKMIHLYRDLEINVAGIASIDHLLHKVDDLHNELWLLRNRLRMYEE
jgi:chaperone modulatory protein CbpM